MPGHLANRGGSVHPHDDAASVELGHVDEDADRVDLGHLLGDHEDPRHVGERPDLAGTIVVPDVLLQAHSASLQMTFYDKAAFPPRYRGAAFASLHGSWNRGKRTGPKVIMVPLEGGAPTGEYEDFMMGFVVDDDAVWARPVGVAVARDGALFVSEDGNGTLWRIAFGGG